MASIKLKGDTSGELTISAPAVAGTNTLTLPASTGTLAITADAYTDSDALSLLNASGSAPVYAVRAWVNFNGTGTVAIRQSGNVSSITDDGVGLYTVNFATDMVDADYAALGLTTGWSVTDTSRHLVINGDKTDGVALKTTSAIRVHTGQTASTGETDMAKINVVIVR